MPGDMHDVAIVGGGFTGLRAALALAEAGTQVAVFEAANVANGASGRSGGQRRGGAGHYARGGSFAPSLGRQRLGCQ